MNFKRISAAALALTMTASLGSALAANQIPDGWTPADGARGPLLIAPAPSFPQIFLNGDELDTSAIPNVGAGLVPMRLVTEADGGIAEWYKEDQEGYFLLANTSITVDFTDNSVSVNFEKLEGVTATVVKGVTFLPADVVNGLEGVEVNLNPELDVDRIDVTTPNGTPIMKLANEIKEVAGMGMGMQQSFETLEEVWGEAHGFKAEFVTEGVAFTPMMINPDTLILGKVAEGKTEELKAALEAFRKQQEETFTWYLSDNLPKTQNAKFVTEGDWFMFIMAENADDAVETFQTGVKAMAQ